MLTVLVVSDATGVTADRVVRSTLAQFPGAEVEVLRRSHVRSVERVRAVVQEAAGRGAMIVHTLVSDELRRLILAESRARDVDALDLMGPLLERLATHLKLTPQEKPGLFEQLAEARSRQIEAVEFAFHHDDGANTGDLDQAEIVLVGVSRTMKTPTALYLAYRGWFAANVPIVPVLPLPPKLASLPPWRVFCLASSPGRLLELRRTRARMTGIPEESYATPQQVGKELLYAERLCAEHGWRKIDVTSRSVEEVSREIIALAGEHAAPGSFRFQA